jgi:succinate dehydrogenase/fumarate reductase-like Fe-S protein
MAEAIFEVFRGNREGGQLATYHVPIAPGMVVLDALHYIQAHQAPDLAMRWNCKAGKCGSCSQRSTAGLVSLARPVWIPFPWTSPSRFTR